MNRIACAIIAIIIIAIAIVFDACIIASYSPTMFLTMFGWGAYGIWDSRAK